MTDRELLEMAAKAAGIEIEEWCEAIPHGCACGFLLPNTIGDLWNPLEFDRDAFRIAVELDIDVCSNIAAQANANDCWEFLCDHKDKYTATRRAIVRAAAEIGAKS